MHKNAVAILICFILAAAMSAPARAGVICTLVADAESRVVLLAEGDCESPVTPASTFKVPLAVMAFDAGIITSAHAPKLPFREGYADWIAAWRQDTDPLMWMQHSNVWYSQRLTEQLGLERLTAYARGFGYGNADFSGDPGRDNGLERSWISSSLKISPLQQAGFFAALVQRRLPVSPAAMEGAIGLIASPGQADGWQIRGKTGSAYPRKADYSFDYARAWGWYAGWAEKAGRRIVFVRLNQEEERREIGAGLRARDAIMAEWPAIMARAGL